MRLQPLLKTTRVAVTVRYGNLVKNERLTGVWDDIEVIEADLRNRGALDQVRQWKPNIVFHLAAYNHVGQSFTQVEECFDVNAKGTVRNRELFSRAQYQRLTEVDLQLLTDAVDRWVLEYAELYAAKS